MQKRFSIFLCSLLLTACSQTPAPGDQHSSEHTTEETGATAQAERMLLIEDQSDAEGTDIAFVVKDEATEEVFQDFGINHTKEMHLIVVRSDLTGFQHLHPVRDESSRWTVAYEPEEPGTYWMYADFVDSAGTQYVLPFLQEFEEPGEGDPVIPQTVATREIDGHTITFEPQMGEDVLIYSFSITEKDGKQVIPGEYLGAKGHSVLIAPSSDPVNEPGEYIHTHPSDEEGKPVFEANVGTSDFYRIFTEFQIDGKVMMVPFDWKR